MAVIFNTVKTYVESVGRSRSIKAWNTLDSLTCIFTGPTITVEQWIPKIGAQHPLYKNMFCVGSEVVNEAAGVTTLRTLYTGKFYDMGQPTIGSSTHQGEVSWTNFDAVSVYQTAPQIPPGGPSGTQRDSNGDLTAAVPAVYACEFVSYTWAATYIITTSIRSTLSRSPSPMIGGGGGSVQVLSRYKTGRSAVQSGNGLVQSVLTFPSVLLDSSCTDLKNGWYEISSTWGPQPAIITSLLNLPTPDLTSTLFNQVTGGD